MIESDEVLRSLPKVMEKLNLLKETIEDTQAHYTLSKDTEDSSFFGYKNAGMCVCPAGHMALRKARQEKK